MEQTLVRSTALALVLLVVVFHVATLRRTPAPSDTERTLCPNRSRTRHPLAPNAIIPPIEPHVPQGAADQQPSR